MMLLSTFSRIYNFHHGNFSPVLIVWLTLGVIGFIVACLNARDAVKDTDALVTSDGRFSANRRTELLIVAKAGIRNEFLRIFKMGAVIVSGIVALGAQPAISDEQRAQLHIPYWTPTGVMIVLLLLTIVGITVVQSVLDLKVRHKLYSRVYLVDEDSTQEAQHDASDQ